LEITAEILASLGISSEAELDAAMEDKDLSAQFVHASSRNVQSFIYAQALIERAKKNILAHLRTLPEYDCSEVDLLAKSVIGGIRKFGQTIYVVTRPSDHGQVIIYYGSEKDTLDYASSELWIDNAIDEPRQLSLGKILKTLGVNRIPV
jgi:hypothetical protein